MFPPLRIIIGLIFIISGAEKLIWPYQNFQYVIESYQLLPSGADALAARVFPWVELILGIFMVLGFWLSVTLRGVMCMFAMFIMVVAQALLRKLPVSECGCFGELISFPLSVVIVMDSILFLSTIFLLKNIEKTERLSLDRYFKS